MTSENNNTLYYGDNLDILKRYIPNESVDLIYLDPPFKSNQDYNVLFADKHGTKSTAQIMVFEDTWHWGPEAESAYFDIVTKGGKVSDVMQAFRTFLSENDMMAYLAMMAPRLVELHRVLKPTGSIYLHCDPTASHYLKLLMDAIFDPRNFRNEIVWKRRKGSSSAVHKSNKFGVCTDSIFFYVKTNNAKFHPQYNMEADGYQDYIKKFFKYTDEKGRIYRIADLSNPAPRPNLMYEYKGYKPHPNGWAISKEKMEQWDKEGRLYFPKDINGRIQRKRFLDELKGKPVQSLWDDIEPIGAQATERLGYPTQKPEALLERIIEASSREGDIILDPFCGCGTAVSVAQKLNRQWTGIDITHLAISLIKHRLKNAYGVVANKDYKVIGEPASLAGAKDLAKHDPYQFQWWALGLVGARPVEQKKGADKGIDGRLYFFDEPSKKTGKPKQIIFSVKAGKVNVSHIRDLRGVLDREKASIGVYISLNKPTSHMVKESASSGFYVSPELDDKKYPKLQLLTISEIFEGKDVQSPQYIRREGNVTFKKAPRVIKVKKEIKKQKKLHEHQ